MADPGFAPMYATRSKRVKTDKRDARTLCEACRLGDYRATHRVSDAQRHVRSELAVRDTLVRIRTRYVALIKAAVRREGFRLSQGYAERTVLKLSATRRAVGAQSVITADAGYHSEQNLAVLKAVKIDALIADNEMRRRDERFATQVVHHTAVAPLHNKSTPLKPEAGVFNASAFTYDAAARTCVCPAGKTLNRAGADRVARDTVWTRLSGKERDCGPCPLRAQCIRDPDATPVRSVMFLRGKTAPLPPTHTARMKVRIDSPEGRARYAERFGAVEPVFGNLCYNKGLTRFTLRSQRKVDGQWKLYCLVHNIEKLAHSGYAA